MPQQEAEARVDIHSFPPADLLSLLAQLLTHIASANDEIGASGINAASAEADYHRAPIWNTLTTASRQALATPSSTLTFHARNVPTISLEAYLVRILKYCPTTNEVFLSLLVYFDRMSKLSLEATGRTFVIDSFNIHRLVIAGVTVASKFFSDVFYTNSRYAKVGGLPLTELNQLELQFLLLNNFSLVISEDEMQQYAEQLVLFSQNHSLSSLPSSIASMAAAASPASHTGSVAPTPAMGAMDAYGGQIPTHPASTTPHADVREPAPPSAISAFQQPRYSGDDTETETETETETDGGSTTDDEPTIRPAHSSAGSISDDASSLYSTSTTSEDADDEEADEIMDGEGMREMDIVEDSDGGRTPDVRKYFGGSTPPRMHAANDDSRMASP
ncbi:cyclin-domain-containing protein [Schizophyllum amplum]|uniref:Cyclin-domain-containing protein n=1 Tax=Schizophyllum amplum TaxID=97359 RepID=A0A550CUV7_9AGAR|nr:cyclin-domain-containing protein [Auriculariopsis ampla]